MLVLPLKGIETRVHSHFHTLKHTYPTAFWLQDFTHGSLAVKAHLVPAVGARDDSVEGRVMDEACSTLSLVE